MVAGYELGDGGARSSRCGWNAWLYDQVASPRRPQASSTLARTGTSSAPAPLRTAQSIESTPSLLRGTRPEVGPQRTSKPPLARVPLANCQRLGRLGVHRRGHTRGTATLGDPGHDKRAPVRADRQLHRVAHTHAPRGLHAFSVESYSSPVDSLGRRATCLEEACRPKPCVDPHLIHDAMIATRLHRALTETAD